jgi:predicted molibdopterin-dependent oxidoreductase YjgC
MANITINGRSIEVSDSATILQAAKLLKIHIPTLCHHPKLTPFGGCRLCVVEVKGMPKPVAACTTTAGNGMEITTSTPQLEEMRKTVLELILSDHPNDCMICEKAGSCSLQDLAYEYGIRENRYQGERRIYPKRDGNPFIERDLEKCILCGRCVKVCDEIQGAEAIDFGYRGFRSKICTNFEEDLSCEFCGQCVSVCPTGALTGKQWTGKGRRSSAEEINTICPYCGTGCNITAHVKDNEILKISSKQNTWNEGWLCVKGRFGYKFVNSPERLTSPLIRRNGRLEEASWGEALDLLTKRFIDIRSEHGSDTVGGLSSARCTNEENYAFQKLIRAGFGTNNVDHCARL